MRCGILFALHFARPFLFFLLFALMALGKWGRSHAVLPVFILGLCLAPMFRSHKELQRKLRIVAFAMITPFFFIKGGMSVSLKELVANWQLLLILFGVKTVAKFVGVWPLAKVYVTAGSGRDWSASYRMTVNFSTPSWAAKTLTCVVSESFLSYHAFASDETAALSLHPDLDCGARAQFCRAFHLGGFICL